MLTVSAALLAEFSAGSEPLAVFSYEDAGVAGAAFLPPAARKALAARAKEEGFQGKAGEVAAFGASDGAKERRFYFVGLGKRKESGAESLRKAAAALFKAAKRRHETVWAAPVEPAQALAEGLLLGAYDYRRYLKPDEERKLSKVVLVAAKAPERNKLALALERAQVFCEAVCWVRDLVNDGPSDKSPEDVTKLAGELAKDGLHLKIIDEKEAAKLGMGALLGVGRGSARPPRLLHLSYKPKGPSRRTVALVGKGVTFDSGGLSLKPAQSMETR